MKFLISLVILMLALSTNLSANNESIGDPILNNPSYIAAVELTDILLDQTMQGMEPNIVLLQRRNFLVARAIVEIYNIHPNNVDQRSLFFEMLNLYINKANEFALQKNRQFYTPQQRGIPIR